MGGHHARTKMTKAILTITDRAEKRISYLLSKKRGALGLKIGVKSGGCSGMSYVVDYAEVHNPLDEVVEGKGMRIFIDAKAVLHLLGTEMDYEESQFKEGFVFINPNEKTRCGCGKSFSV